MEYIKMLPDRKRFSRATPTPANSWPPRTRPPVSERVLANKLTTISPYTFTHDVPDTYIMRINNAFILARRRPRRSPYACSSSATVPQLFSTMWARYSRDLTSRYLSNLRFIRPVFSQMLIYLGNLLESSYTSPLWNKLPRCNPFYASTQTSLFFSPSYLHRDLLKPPSCIFSP